MRSFLPQEESMGISDVEQEVNQYLGLSLGSLGFTIAGALFYAPLTLVALPALIYVYIPWFKDACHSLVYEKRLRMIVVDAVLVTGLLAAGMFVSAAVLASWISLSKKLLLKVEDQSLEKILNIFGEQPRSVYILKDTVEIEIPVEDLAEGDRIVVHAGETIAVDGTIVEGHATIDQRVLTGESQPAEKGPGDQVFALTIVLSGKIQIETAQMGQLTVAAQIGDILNHTADYRRSLQWQWLEFVDKMALPTLLAGALTLPFVGAAGALGIMYSVSFPYCMRVFAPVTLLNFLNLASRNSVLIKDGRSLELLSQVDTVVFDKTGTLTEEQPHVGKVYALGRYDEDNVLKYAAAAEHKQTHPIAKAIRQEAANRSLDLPAIEESAYKIGYGLQVKIEQKLIRVGSTRFMQLEGLTLPIEVEQIQNNSHEYGYSLICVAIDEQVVGLIELHPTVRPEAKEIVTCLQKRGKAIYIISGDHEKPTRQLATSLGIEHYFAETLPEHKADLIAQLQAEGKVVCFIGDGINDSIALKKANISISLSGASSVATDTAQIILMDESLQQLDTLFSMADSFDKTMDGGLQIMVVPNALGVLGVFFLGFGFLSAAILYYVGVVLSLSYTTYAIRDEQRLISDRLRANQARQPLL